MEKVVVLGAGVSGLTTAICLLRNGYKDVVVVGKHLPGEMTWEYTSPWAGASILSFASSKDKFLQEIDRESLKEFTYLESHVPEANIMYCPGVELFDEPAEPGEDRLWVRNHYNEFEELSREQLPEGAISGYRFSTFTACVPRYLTWLTNKLKELGGRLERDEFKSLDDLMEKYKDVHILVNCSGLGASHLTDVQDATMYPIRGQIVVVRAPHVKKQLYRTDRPDGREVVICHNYGHGSHGYQSSWGSGAEVVRLLLNDNVHQSKL
ncbi:hypothetical protein EC973_005121 [Apophysomyces ossiformis]|uniref:FAD dependent oxidoreductase domain-containing protein n=1 Tax=Apophysomyces ossiformis TaxID=679940 RepID=A0A8H7BJT3_9FUNG|nr:hypothetical protein EC973_005121 [Apophysomyces ossiformis]